MATRLAHRHPDDRNLAPLRFRPELFLALAKHAIHLSGRRRRRAGHKPANVLDVADRDEIWFQGPQSRVLERYGDQLTYLRKQTGINNGQAMSTRTLERHVRRLRDLKLVKVGNYSRYDKRLGHWVQEWNVYTITRPGILWIRANARTLKIPSVL